RRAAVDALAALGCKERDDVVARPDEGCPRPDRLDDARALVAEHARRVAARIGARGGVEIGVAVAARREPDERLAGFRLLEPDVLDDERLPELLENCGADVQKCEVAPAGSWSYVSEPGSSYQE